MPAPNRHRAILRRPDKSGLRRSVPRNDDQKIKLTHCRSLNAAGRFFLFVYYAGFMVNQTA